ncbi:MAG TPA: 5-(carboxyamino)imidazole ribonucleotide mutase [Catalimonadaceae bacterium]|jgi:5-(carboxyamino)imidazole ribonucleotide mutase|nr:5-(carboxyamino)imidazole ribonucleotide mutase [Catalimonadaceae bacterium]
MTGDIQVSIIMGSISDLEIMEQAAETLKSMGIRHEITVVSAHRTPKRMFDFALGAADRGIKVIIAGAGGAAHLPGMVASLTSLPVIGVPIKSKASIDGWDSILSILQMPTGVPVATVALDNATNAAVLAAQILAISEPLVAAKLKQHKESLRLKVEESIKKMEDKDFMND